LPSIPLTIAVDAGTELHRSIGITTIIGGLFVPQLLTPCTTSANQLVIDRLRVVES